MAFLFGFFVKTTTRCGEAVCFPIVFTYSAVSPLGGL